MFMFSDSHKRRETIVKLVTMNRSIRNNIDALRLLAKSKRPKQCKAIIEAADKDLIRCLCECIQNVMVGNVPIPQSKRTRLKRHRNILRNIVDKRTRYLKKKKLLSQTGGFLPLLLAPIIGLAGSLIGDAISGAINR